MSRLFLQFIFLLICSAGLYAQHGVAINRDGSLPHTSAILDIKSSGEGVLIPRLTDAERIAIISPAIGLMIYQTNSAVNSPKGFYLFNNGWQRMLLYSEIPASTWRTSGNDMYSTLSGNVGIGRNTPSYKLHVGQETSGDGILIEGINPIFQFRQGNLNGEFMNTGFIQLSGDDLRIGTNAGNNSGDFVIRTGGYNRVVVTSSGTMRFLDQAGSSIGSLGSSGNDLRIGAQEKLYMNDEIYTNAGANATGFGVAAPTERADVNGNAVVGGHMIVEGELVSLQKGSTNNLLPLCYGHVNYQGTLQHGTANVTVSRESLGSGQYQYKILCEGITSSSLVMVTPVLKDILYAGDTWNTSVPANGTMILRFNMVSNTNFDVNTLSAFNFIIYTL